jgi:hypothetical protein
MSSGRSVLVAIRTEISTMETPDAQRRLERGAECIAAR